MESHVICIEFLWDQLRKKYRDLIIILPIIGLGKILL